MDQLARDLVVRHQAACAVVTGGSVRGPVGWITKTGAFGRLEMSPASAPVDVDSWFDLASLTKSITALAAVRLARRGRLDLRAPLASLLPEIEGTPSASVPLELLLAHRAGLSGHQPLFRHLACGRLAPRVDMLREAANARRNDAVGAPPEMGFPPVYSDLGYLLAGEAVARAGGASLDTVLAIEVLAPLGADLGSSRQLSARDASFERRVAATEIVEWRGGTLRGVVHDENAWAFAGSECAGHAGLFGRVAGVLAVGRAVIDVLHGRMPSFLTQDEFAPLATPRPGGTLRAGFDGKSAVGSSSGTKFGMSTIGHLGFTGTSFWCDVDREMVGVVLTNRVHPTRQNEVIRQVRPLAYDRIAEWAARQHAAMPSHAPR